MAEAHQAVAFSFTITHEGVNINYDQEVLHVIWRSGVCSIKRRINRVRNNIHNGVYPGSLRSLFVINVIITTLYFAGIDLSYGAIRRLELWIPGERLAPLVAYLLTCGLYSVFVWIGLILLLRYALKILFMYKGWIYELRGGTGMSFKSRTWLLFVKLLEGKKPLLYSYQYSLPCLPLPSLDDTMKRYLVSIRPLCNNQQFVRMEKLVDEFKSTIGPKLQHYLWLKSWWSTNYVSDWWEEYVYLRGRSPLMVNSNFYGIDALLAHPTTNQAARAANIIYAAILFRRSIDRQTLEPIMVQNTVPLCSWQYERLFNTTRIPGIETDKLMHMRESQHICVYHQGRYFKLPLYHKARLLRPIELQRQLEKIIKDDSLPQAGEEKLGALTAADRVTWATTRNEYFCKGLNKTSLDIIEKAAFCVVLEDESFEFDPKDSSELDRFSQLLLHGKGYDRWYDKSFNLVVTRNGRIGFNAEHSWADAPIMAHLWEFCLSEDFINLGYTKEGNALGELTVELPTPVRLKWDISQDCIDIIESCAISARTLLEDVDLHLYMHDAYGKGIIKKCKVSPDAYIQMALQLAYYRDARKFSLTYEASMTRLFREGRTETVRPVSIESCTWVKAMEDPLCSTEEKRSLLRRACAQHQTAYQDSMCGKGIDRHLFCLYVVSKYLEVDSPFLREVLSEPWKLSTSQTPHGQTNLLDLKKYPDHISAGGGFGPVADDGYGVSYIIAGENIVFFHISSKRSSPETDSQRFAGQIEKAMADMKALIDF
ncbi:carnitine O-palmitoyltransferase 1, liver isoform-like [Limulus polyphemus]|uniref:Carnitine O-palmitoyltransferase 1, liver isoform-like n=1 Tax=Limulus polyphemus TaxID=6850 RepID=A0ABM1SWI5_LIMPO|nr:carnitine O-palmitoyltransferase 1, liver isoform-like [Limulus polyphemus]XP_022247991.1 carnitine O-palmitoyltransferase 1, liver isoform-like [Limulus polyphemus]